MTWWDGYVVLFVLVGIVLGNCFLYIYLKKYNAIKKVINDENEKKQMMLTRLKRIIPLMEWRGVIKDGSFIRLYLSSKTTMTLNCRLYVESCEETYLMSEYVTAQDDSNYVLDVLSSGNTEPITGKYYFGINKHDIDIYRNDYNWSDAFSWFDSEIKLFVDTCQYKSIAIEYDGSIESPSIMIRFKT